jgi:hypothetical protein
VRVPVATPTLIPLAMRCTCRVVTGLCTCRVVTGLCTCRVVTGLCTAGNPQLRMPLVGIGTWKGQPGQMRAAVEHALRAGYRHVDCAEYYGMCLCPSHAHPHVLSCRAARRALGHHQLPHPCSTLPL